MKQKMLLMLLFTTFGMLAQQRLTVFFDFNKYDLTSEARIKINSLIAENDNLVINKIYGFCDWKGSNPYNDTLSMQRIQTVLDYLKSQNIAVAATYETRGFGEDFVQSKIQAENRKVVIVYDTVAPKEPEEQIPAAITLQQKIKNAHKGDFIKLDHIEFYNMSARIVPQSKDVLYQLLCVMQANLNLKIEIQGHICCQLEGDINNLSVTRARSIYNYLIRNKINRNRLSYRGFGVSKPIHPIPEKNEQQQDENRRVEIMIVEN